MNIETFFEKFDLFADAPGAVGKMRKLVLELAFSGNLSGVKHDDDRVPEGWEKRTIESICSTITPGFACSRSHQMEGGHVHLRTHNISTMGTLNFDLLVQIDPNMVDSQKASLRKGDILFNNTNSQELVGKTSLVDRDYEYGFSNHITRLRLNEDVFPGFVVFYLTMLRNSGYFAKLCTRWINQAAVNTDTLRRETIALPPLAEQKRIVAKVDELMALCDRLEAQQQERETRHAALARASLARFADAPTPANLNFLFHPSYTISPADLRKSVLTLAVQGKLVPQDPNDGNTRTVTMEELVGRKNLKNGLSLSPVDGPSDFVFLPLSAMNGSTIDCSFGKPITIDADRAAPYLIKPRDVFVIRGNGSKERVGIAGMARACPANVLFPDLFIRIPLPLDKIEADYFLIAWNSPVTREMLESLATTTAGIWKVNQGHISECAIPLPPLSEQRRIVAKVEHLMALVDALETQLAASRAAAANLLSALVAELTGTPEGRVAAPAPAKPVAGSPRPKPQNATGASAKPTAQESTVSPRALADLRKSAGLSQAAVAKAMGLNQAYISQMETGKRLITDEQRQKLLIIYAYNAAK
jgi:type I restriction enzyme S subunit